MRRLQARAVVVAGAVLGAGLVLAAGAPAAPTWTAPTQLAPGYDPSVAVDPSGDALVGFSASTLTEVIARRSGATTWTDPAKLAEGGSSPTVALDDAGDAFAVFTNGAWPSDHFQATVRSGADGDWQAPVTVSPAPESAGGALAVNASGDAVATFTTWSGHGYVVGAASRAAASGQWQDVVDLSDPNGNSPLGAAVAIDRAGTAAALWTKSGPTADNPVLEASIRPAGAAWTSPAELGGPYRSASEWQLKLDPAGNAVAAWIGDDGSGDAVFTSQRPVGGAWAPAAVLARPARGLEIRNLALTVDASGNAVAAWNEVTQGVWTAVRPASSGAWQPAVRLTPAPVYVVNLALAADRAGNDVAVWLEGFPDSDVRAALRPAASGSWEPAATIASVADASNVSVASDDRGGAVAVWDRLTADQPSVSASELRAGGPVLARLNVPATGAVRVPTTFAVTPAAWVAPLVGEPMWSFGDGGSGSGRRVVHTYRRTGTYTVTVTDSDSTGATSTSRSTIVVGTAALANARLPGVTGRPVVGAQLTCLRGSWRGTQPITFRYAWLRNRIAVGRTPLYRVRPRDKGASISCRVTATNGALMRTATSRPIRIIR